MIQLLNFVTENFGWIYIGIVITTCFVSYIAHLVDPKKVDADSAGTCCLMGFFWPFVLLIGIPLGLFFVISHGVAYIIRAILGVKKNDSSI